MMGGVWKGTMTGEATLKEVIGRLGRAIEALEKSAAARLENEQDYSEAEAEVQRMNADRAKLASELDNSEARAERLEEACARLRAEPALVDLPPRISLFGLTRLPTTYLEVLQALAAARDVHLFLLRPESRAALWHRACERRYG